MPGMLLFNTKIHSTRHNMKVLKGLEFFVKASPAWLCQCEMEIPLLTSNVPYDQVSGFWLSDQVITLLYSPWMSDPSVLWVHVLELASGHKAGLGPSGGGAGQGATPPCPPSPGPAAGPGQASPAATPPRPRSRTGGSGMWAAEGRGRGRGCSCRGAPPGGQTCCCTCWRCGSPSGGLKSCSVASVWFYFTSSTCNNVEEILLLDQIRDGDKFPMVLVTLEQFPPTNGSVCGAQYLRLVLDKRHVTARGSCPTRDPPALCRPPAGGGRPLGVCRASAPWPAAAPRCPWRPRGPRSGRGDPATTRPS